MISYREMEDFEATIINAGFEVDDFNVGQLEDEPTTIEHAVTGTVTVLRISTGDARKYNGGHLSTWLSEFDADLHAGEFGQP